MTTPAARVPMQVPRRIALMQDLLAALAAAAHPAPAPVALAYGSPEFEAARAAALEALVPLTSTGFVVTPRVPGPDTGGSTRRTSPTYDEVVGGLMSGALRNDRGKQDFVAYLLEGYVRAELPTKPAEQAPVAELAEVLALAGLNFRSAAPADQQT